MIDTLSGIHAVKVRRAVEDAFPGVTVHVYTESEDHFQVILEPPPRGKQRRGVCPTPKCDTDTALRKDGMVRKHAANEFCDGQPAPPARTWEAPGRD